MTEVTEAAVRELWEFVFDADYEFTRSRPRPWYLLGAEKAPARGVFDHWKASRDVREILERHNVQWPGPAPR